MKRAFLILLILGIVWQVGNAQNKSYIRLVCDTLSSPYMAGRGYVDQGTLKAADYIRNEISGFGLQPLWPGFFQEFTIPINTIVGDVEMSIGNTQYNPGTDFTFSSFSKGMNQEMALTILPAKAYKDMKSLKRFFRKNKNIEALVLDLSKVEDKEVKALLQTAAYQKSLPVKACIFLTEKAPGWHVARAATEMNYLVINLRAKLPVDADMLRVRFSNKYHQAYPTQNVGAFIPGSVYPDSFIVFTAHYDHLGMMGNKAYFPGYNDNASGTAMLLDLAREFNSNPIKPELSIAFLFLSAEETGLKGAYYAASNPPFPLPKINSLINLDMVGTGSDGITVVNANVYPAVYQKLDSLNKVCSCLPEIAARNESPNSDHHAFHEKGVSAVFIYTRGKEYQEYHTVIDKGPLPLSGYDGLFHLLQSYVRTR